MILLLLWRLAAAAAALVAAALLTSAAAASAAAAVAAAVIINSAGPARSSYICFLLFRNVTSMCCTSRVAEMCCFCWCSDPRILAASVFTQHDARFG